MKGYLDKVNNWIDENKELILGTIYNLVRIRTENLSPGGNEKQGQDYLYNFVRKSIPEANVDIFDILEVEGIKSHKDYFPTVDGVEKNYCNRPNLMAKLPGRGNGKSMLFSGHMDTMSINEKKWNIFHDPFSGKIRDGKMYGRGTLDMKAGLACGFFAMKCINDLKVGLKGDIYAESVIDEEYGGVNGTIANRIKYPGIDFAILSEPTGLKCGVESMRGTDWKIIVIEKGPGGIAFSGKKLKNPIYKIAKIINAIEKFERYLNKVSPTPKNYKKNEKLEVLTYQVASGGTSYLESQAIPLKGHIYLWFYTYEYMNEKQVEELFLNFMKKELSKYKVFENDFPRFEKVIRYMEGHKTDTGHGALSAIENAFKLLNISFRKRGLIQTNDAYAFKKIGGTEVVVIVPVGANAHGIDEYVEVDSVFRL
ncbi:MAG: M20/M25/M40 family metallo-hydrolase [Actinobacteria bacterium]|nr:M20/M25/M40 family metallo-hydrolase [Actinomycetota bacterium]